MYQPRVLAGVLTKEQREAGFSLRETEDMLELILHKQHIAFFSSTGATVQEIQAIAEKYTEGKEQIGGKATERETIKETIADWIDTDVIAEMLIEALEDEGIPVTFKAARELYLTYLDQIGPALAKIIEQ